MKVGPAMRLNVRSVLVDSVMAVDQSSLALRPLPDWPMQRLSAMGMSVAD